MAEAPATNYTNIFGSPLMAHRWADAETLNRDLRAAVLRHEAVSPSEAKTNVGGWHSAPAQLEFCGEAGKTLITRMREMADEATRRVFEEYGQSPRKLEWTLHAWVNVNRAGHFNRIHTHPGSTWSGDLLRRHRYARRRQRRAGALASLRPLPGPGEHLSPRHRAVELHHSPGAWPDGALPKLPCPHGAPAHGRGARESRSPSTSVASRSPDRSDRARIGAKLAPP